MRTTGTLEGHGLTMLAAFLMAAGVAGAGAATAGQAPGSAFPDQAPASALPASVAPPPAGTPAMPPPPLPPAPGAMRPGATPPTLPPGQFAPPTGVPAGAPAATTRGSPGAAGSGKVVSVAIPAWLEGGANSALIGLLRTQKDAVTRERAEILSRRSGQRALTPSGSTPQGAPLPPIASASTTVNPTIGPNPGAPASRVATVMPPSSSVGSAIGTATGPDPTGAGVRPGPAPRSAPSAAAIQTGMLQNCFDGKPRILAVAGVDNHTAVFTPEVGYNQYTIRGCHFGMQQGSLHLYGAFKSHVVAMTVEQWNDDAIVAFVDPNVTGELDLANVTLVVAPVGGPQISDSGYRFLAARGDPIRLNSIPGGSVASSDWPDAPGPEWGKTDNYFDGVIYHHVGPGAIPTGNDRYRFDWVKAGWAVSRIDLSLAVIVECFQDHTYRTFATDGNLGYAWQPDRTLAVSYMVWQCPRGTARAPHAGSQPVSIANYDINIWVVGPRGFSY
jgi:hypothetical protein